MKNWNRTGKIKATILVLLSFINIVNPLESFTGDLKFHFYLGPLLFGLIGIPIIVKMNTSLFGQVLAKPSWNDNPLTLKRPLTFFHFVAYFMISAGLSLLVGTFATYQEMNSIGIMPILFGLGILGGIRLTLRSNPID